MRRFTPKIGYPKKLVTPKNWLPQKIDLKKNGYPPKKCYPKKKDQKRKLATPKKLAYFIARGVYYQFLEKWRTLFCTGLLMRFKHYRSPEPFSLPFLGEQVLRNGAISIRAEPTEQCMIWPKVPQCMEHDDPNLFRKSSNAKKILLRHDKATLWFYQICTSS